MWCGVCVVYVWCVQPRADGGVCGFSVDGIEACRQLREAGVTAPIIAATANGDERHRRMMTEAGFTLLVTKPYDRGDLKCALTAAVSSSAAAEVPTALPVGGRQSVFRVQV